MILRFDSEHLSQTVLKQLNNFFVKEISMNNLSSTVDEALQRVEVCFNPIKLKYYRRNGDSYFDQNHSDHYAMFLYLLSRSFHRNDNSEYAELVFLLNKYLHGIDVFYEVELPDVFLFVHPLGTVIGNAKFGRYTVFYQNVSIGAKASEGHPTFGDSTIFYSKSAVIGTKNFGSNIVFGANSFVIDESIEGNSVVTGATPNLQIKKLNVNFVKEHIFE